MLVDITRTLNSNIYTYAGDPKFSLKTICDINSAGFNVSQISMGSHCGTHVDAPKHFFGDLNGISDINLNTLCGKAFIADVSSLKNVDRNFLNGLNFSLFDIFILKTKNKDIFLTLNGAQELISKKIKAVGTECFDIEDEKITGFSVHKTLLKAQVPIIEGLKLDGIKSGIYKFYCFPLKVENCDGAPARAAVEM